MFFKTCGRLICLKLNQKVVIVEIQNKFNSILRPRQTKKQNVGVATL